MASTISTADESAATDANIKALENLLDEFFRDVSNERKARVEKFYYKIEFTDKTVCNEGGENCYCHLLHYQFSFFKKKQLAPVVVVSTAAAVPIVETTLGTAEFMPGLVPSFYCFSRHIRWSWCRKYACSFRNLISHWRSSSFDKSLCGFQGWSLTQFLRVSIWQSKTIA